MLSRKVTRLMEDLEDAVNAEHDPTGAMAEVIADLMNESNLTADFFATLFRHLNDSAHSELRNRCFSEPPREE